MSAYELSSTIDRLYAAAYDPLQWPEALRALENFTGSDGAVLSIVPYRSHEAGRAIGGGISDSECDEFSSRYMRICRRIAFGRDHPGVEFTYDALIMSEAEMDEDPVYQWWSRSGLRYHVGAALSGADGHHCNISLQRARARGHAGDADIKTFALVKPHLKRAVEMASSLGSMRSRWQFSLSVLHGMPQGLVILNGDGRATFTNHAAEAIFAVNDALQLTEGYLAAKRQTDAYKLDRAIRDALELGAGESTCAGKWVSISRPTTSLPYSVFVAPLSAEATLTETEGRGALVVIHDLTRKTKVDENILSALFGLTTKEASVASAIGSGLELSSVAADLHIAPATARVHLGSIYRKLSIGRQQDLVGLVHSLTPLGG